MGLQKILSIIRDCWGIDSMPFSEKMMTKMLMENSVESLVLGEAADGHCRHGDYKKCCPY
jgi:hypothetical protein